MKYLTSLEVAEKWNISDRRVRKLASEGRIDGVKQEGKTYYIPVDAEKPEDRRFRVNESKVRFIRTTRFILKWEDEIIGRVDEDWELEFFKPNYNEVVSIYSKGEKYWSANQVLEFLSERIISKDRRDIEKALYRLNLNSYDVYAIAEKTRAINAKDLLWLSKSEDEKFSNVITEVFDSVFLKSLDMQAYSLDTPEGYNIKRYGVYNRCYGIYKQRINPLSTDCESEIAVCKLAKLLGVSCCDVARIDSNTIFSKFEYDFAKEYIVHFRRLVKENRSNNEYQNLISVRPQYQKEIVQMIALDFITRQDDRHLSNLAIKVSDEKESFYPLYDNGRSLFYEDTEETVSKAINDIQGYSTSFGISGTYYNYVTEIANNGVSFSKLLNLDITKTEIEKLLIESGFKDYRLAGATTWICKCIEYLRRIS